MWNTETYTSEEKCDFSEGNEEQNANKEKMTLYSFYRASEQIYF